MYKILILFLFIITCMEGKSCNCLPGGSIEENVLNSDFIVKAKIISFSYTNRLDTMGVDLLGDPRNTFSRYWSFNVKVYKALVMKTYKGYLSSDTVFIVTGVNRAACKIDFLIGGDYIVYGFEKDYMGFSNVQRMSTNNKLFWTNSCTRSDYYTNEEEKNLIIEIKKENFR